MLQRDLKTIASESIFNPNKPDVAEKILLDVGNVQYYVTKAQEHIHYADKKIFGTDDWHEELKQAIKLLILARAAERET